MQRDFLVETFGTYKVHKLKSIVGLVSQKKSKPRFEALKGVGMFSFLRKLTSGIKLENSARIREHFDAKYYLSQFSEEEQIEIVDPFRHFLTYWHQNGYDPNPFFSMSNYLLANPDVAAASINPLVHFVENGIAENRPLLPKFVPRLFDDEIESTEHEDFSLEEDLTDPIVYLTEYLFTLGIEPKYEANKVDEAYYRSYFANENIGDCQAHFDETGWRIGLNPTPWFNTNFYLKYYDDVANSGMNPFTHFVTQGYLEKRVPNNLDLNKFNSILKGQSIETESRSWTDLSRRYQNIELPVVKKNILMKKIKNGSLVVSVGHSRYLRDVGGIQLYTYIEAEKFKELRMNYLHVSPSVVLPVLAEQSSRDLYVNITLNNEEIAGDLLLSDLPDLVSDLTPEIRPEALILNSLFGWHPELLEGAIREIDPLRSYWIFHDYSSFCSNPRLSFEDAESCNNPKLGSNICSTCRYGLERDSHVSRVSSLRESRNWQFVTPSNSASKNVSKFLRMDPKLVRTIPHGRVKVGSKQRVFQRKPRIAYVGHPVAAKGWLNFVNFVNLGLQHFDFFHFGAVDAGERGISFSRLVNDFEDLFSARNLLVNYQIDAVFVCPTWQETFCFVVYDALSAGCQIICNSASGNVFDASIESQILLDKVDAKSVERVKEELMKARNFDRRVSEFEFTGTIASEFLR